MTRPLAGAAPSGAATSCSYATRSEKARVTAAVRLETFSLPYRFSSWVRTVPSRYAHAAGDLGIGAPASQPTGIS